MKKPAPIDHEVHDLIRTRWSPRAFSDRTIEEPALRSLLEAARWAPSCFNEQPWNFVIARREAEADFQRLLSCLVDKNQLWAKEAAVLMITVAQRAFRLNGVANVHAWHDVGLSVAQLSLQATALGISVHQMAGIDRARTRTTLAIPESHEPVTAVALGYAGEPSSLPEALATMEVAERARRPQADFVFTGRWPESPKG